MADPGSSGRRSNRRIISPIAPARSGIGALRATRTRGQQFPHLTHAYTGLAQVIRESGLTQRTPWFYASLAAALLLALGGAATGFVLLEQTWYQLLIAAALGVVFTQVAFLAHEAAHRAIHSSGPANDRSARILGAIAGLGYSWWDRKHSRHHGNPNQIGRDPDIEIDTISFVEEDAAKARGLRAFITRRQGWLFFPLLTLEGFNLHWLGIKHLLTAERGKARWIELATLLLRHALIVAPIFLWLPTGMAFAFVGVMVAVFGVYMGATFAPNHKGMPVIERDVRLDFLSKQVRTSRNIRGGWWATWLMGGLNHQIEHHLFPSMPRPHLARTREIVREHCATLDVPYTETSLIESYRIVIDYLNRVGLSARDPFDCPMVAQYRRAG